MTTRHIKKSRLWQLGAYILLCGWMLFLSNPLLSKETVIWRVTDWPPFYILDGQDKGKGIYDEIISMISRHIPEYDHQTVRMNTVRVRVQWSLGEKVCHPSVIVGEQFNTQSVVNSILLPHRIIVHKDKVNLLRKDEVSLDQLLADTQHRGGVTPGRYTPLLNDVVKQHKGRKHLYLNPNYDRLIEMILLKRLDYIIEYPPIIAYTAKQMGLDNPTKSLGIQETKENSYLSVAVGCNKNAWGKAMIDKINQVLIKESQNPDFLESRLRWYDEPSRKILHKIYQDVYFKDKM